MFNGQKLDLRLVLFCSLVVTVFAVGCAGSVSSKSYEVTIPEKWKQEISVGELTIDSNAFYGVPWFLGLFPVVRLNLPVENLTTETLYMKVNYRTESKIKGYSNSGMGVCYALAANQKRLIDTIVPIAAITRPIKFLLRMSEPSSDFDPSVSCRTVVVTIDPFHVSKAPSKEIDSISVENEFFEVKEIQPEHSEDNGNFVVFKVRNITERDAMLRAYIALNDPENIETKGPLARQRGFFFDTIEKIPAGDTASITVPYNIPPVGPGPVLVYSLFVPLKEDIKPNGRDVRDWDMTLVGYGSIYLNLAAEQGRCVIPIHAPVEERAKLTVQKKTEHFLLRYRPGSYAEKHLDKAVSERETAYRRLSDVLKMELPEIVTIDLYPDMEAKALGSGTSWTPANTRNNKHICEVYNEEYETDPHHELAHIFSYHFPNYSSNQGGIVESLAAYFEVHNMPVPETTRVLKRQLSEGKLDSLLEILQSEGSCEELVILIDFLLTKDVEKFKKFYVSVTKSQKKSDIEKACSQIYGIELKDMEKQWHDYINVSDDI